MSGDTQQTHPGYVGEICAILEDKKAEHVTVLDLRGLSDVLDYFIIASGTGVPHLKALQDEIVTALKRRAGGGIRSAGQPESGWVVVDYQDVLVHLFSRDMREYYDLEGLWNDAPRVGRAWDSP
ncbi:ribosome silencing factor [Kiritimatiella glycovorans]|uniref:Ribosomal silencing factor RsfS n=1 Tax=Kiritimatiella glycovorans TaxID=1307763 RepID=A0A0G3EK42_9BACT|nr:ribosome silencing factor [Kiritimatiella glycovorans]AKJ65170.1 Ribosomal silencing factor RsfS [Kiritimatiella glycovorans]